MVKLPTRSNRAWSEVAGSVYTPNVAPVPLVMRRGRGCYVWDVEGNQYFDAISGIAVGALGHAHPDLVAAISDQASSLLHTSNLFLNEPAVHLAERIVGHCFADRVFFCNSGAEANEAAIKLARRYHWRRNDLARTGIVTFEGAFHGRTYGALAATPQPKYQEGFGPMLDGFSSVPYGDIESLRSRLDDRTAAVLVEPIQGEGGVRVPPAGFLEACRAATEEVGALLIVDEVQTGFGRTARMFAHQREAIAPDIMCLAKGIASGLPLGAIAARAEVAEALVPGTHNSTYSGNPVACRAAHVVLDVLEQDGFLASVEARGALLREGLKASGVFKEVRGFGLLVGAELAEAAPFDIRALISACRERGVLVHSAGSSVLRLAPPLVVSQGEAETLLSRVVDAVKALFARPAH